MACKIKKKEETLRFPHNKDFVSDNKNKIMKTVFRIRSNVLIRNDVLPGCRTDSNRLKSPYKFGNRVREQFFLLTQPPDREKIKISQPVHVAADELPQCIATQSLSRVAF